MTELCKAEIQPLVDTAMSTQGAAALDLWGPLFLPISEQGFLGFLVIARGVPFGDVSVLMTCESANGAVCLFFDEPEVLSAGANLFKDVVITVSMGWCPWGTPILWVSSEV